MRHTGGHTFVHLLRQDGCSFHSAQHQTQTQAVTPQNLSALSRERSHESLLFHLWKQRWGLLPCGLAPLPGSADQSGPAPGMSPPPLHSVWQMRSQGWRGDDYWSAQPHSNPVHFQKSIPLISTHPSVRGTLSLDLISHLTGWDGLHDAPAATSPKAKKEWEFLACQRKFQCFYFDWFLNKMYTT